MGEVTGREAEEQAPSKASDGVNGGTATNGSGGAVLHEGTNDAAVANGAAAANGGAPPIMTVPTGHGMGMGGGGMGGGGGGAPLSLKNLRTFSSFKNRVFRLYYGAMLGQMAAMNMQMFARSLLVLRLTDSAAYLGVMALANAAPMLFFSLFGGVMAERVEKKYILIWGQVVSGLMTLAVAVSLTLGFMSVENTNSWLILIGASLVQGTIMGLMMPARQAIIADIVGGEQLMNAVALNTLGMNSLRLLAPMAAGFIVSALGGADSGVDGFAPVYYVMTAMYVVAVGFIILMPKVGTISLQGRGALRDVVDGFRYVRRDPTILVLLIITFLTVLFSMSYMFLLPVFTEDVWNVGADSLAVLMGISGLGAMAGSILLASLPNKKRGIMLLGGSMILGMALIGFSVSGSFLMASIMIVFVGVGQTARMTLGNTLLQYYVRDEYRGRVMSMMMMEFGMTSFIVFFAGIITEALGDATTIAGVTLHGVQWTVGGLAVLLVVTVALTLVFVPRLRKLE